MTGAVVELPSTIHQLEVELPTTPAEQWIAARAVVSWCAAELAWNRLDESHFASPACWWVLVAATAHDERGSLDEDVHIIAQLAGIEPALIWEWINDDGCPVAFDFAGTVAREVRETAARRSAAIRLVDELASLRRAA